MSASDPEVDNTKTALDPVTQEKIREFCYELALALRRITGRVVEDPMIGLPIEIGEKEPKKTTDQKN